MRGLLSVLDKLSDSGVETVGYMQNYISQAVWAISYYAKYFGMRAVVYMPKYKDGLKFE